MKPPTDRDIKINVYRSGDEWFGARWIDGEYDGCDELPCGGEASESEAMQSAQEMRLSVTGPRTVRRVEDVAP